jgi:multicomponent Na+:H+ antiporter subunit D
MGHDKLNNLRGVAQRLPVTTFTIALSCVTLIGLPPSAGFIGKWLLLAAALQSGQWWWVPVLIVGGLLTASYAFVVLSGTFQLAGGEPLARRPRRIMEITALVLSLASFFAGLRVDESMQLLAPETLPAGGSEVWP